MKTGWPQELLQDDSKELSRWFASRIDARRCVRDRVKEIEMSIEYELSVWRKAAKQAEELVMSRIATPPGGKLPTETLDAYIARTNKLLEAAISDWRFATATVADIKSRDAQP